MKKSQNKSPSHAGWPISISQEQIKIYRGATNEPVSTCTTIADHPHLDHAGRALCLDGALRLPGPAPTKISRAGTRPISPGNRFWHGHALYAAHHRPHAPPGRLYRGPSGGYGSCWRSELAGSIRPARQTHSG